MPRRVHAREAGLDHRQPDVVGRVDEGAPRRGPAVLRHDGLLLELDAGGAQLGGGGIDVVDDEADVVDGAALGGGRRALGVLGSEDPDVPEAHAFVLVRVHGPFTAEHLLVPGEGRLRIARTQVDVVEADVRLILHQLDPGAPRIEDVAVQVAACGLAQRRAAGEALQPHAGAPDADRFELGHLRRQVGVREPDVVDAGSLRAAHGRLRDEGHLDAEAVGRIVAVRHRLAAEVLRVPAHRLRGCGRT